jgi:GDP-L-fucose synthase
MSEIILITGGSGLVGTAIRRLVDNATNCVFLSSADFDLSDMEQTKLAFRTHNPKYVIHLAACVGGLFKNMNNKVEMLEKNMLINYNVVKCCHDFSVKKMIACLSTCIFPDQTTYPINETMLHNGPPHSSNDAYAYAKRMLHTHCKAYRDVYCDNFVCVIPTNIYGPADNYSLEDGHVIPSLIHKCYLAKQNGEDFVVRGTGSPLRQFIYSEDLAKIIMGLLSYYNDDEVIVSVSESEEVSIADVARLIADKFDYGDRIRFDSSYSDGQYQKTADNSKLLSLIGSNYKFTGICDGIHMSIDWFVANYSTARK